MATHFSLTRIGIFGAGTIGQMVARHIDDGHLNAVLSGLTDADTPKVATFAATLQSAPPVLDLDELLDDSDWIVEAASQAALPVLIPCVLAHRKNVLVMSVGGLLDREDWFREAASRGCRILFPSGAIAGLDGLRAACVGKMESVTLTSRKPVRALAGTRFISDQGIDLASLTQDTVIFDGLAADAARVFPATSNVAAALALTVGDRCAVRVRVVASPSGDCNVHEIEARGEFGSLRMLIENVPSETNPRTSKLAALSALATLAGITDSSLTVQQSSAQRAEPPALSLPAAASK